MRLRCQGLSCRLLVVVKIVVHVVPSFSPDLIHLQLVAHLTNLR